MLQKGSKVLIIDNSGAKFGLCIHVYEGYKRRYANIKSKILLTIKEIKHVKAKGTKKRQTLKPRLKLKKGMVLKGIVVETKIGIKKYSGDKTIFTRNTAVLLSEKKKFLGTRLFTPVSVIFRKTKYSRLMFMGRGFIRQ